MATKLTDRERKYRKEAQRARADLKLIKGHASQMAEVREMFLRLDRQLHAIKCEQAEQLRDVKGVENSVSTIMLQMAHDRDLINEVNAHMWQTQNRLGAVRDFMVKHMAPTRPSIWSRAAALIKKCTQWK